MLEPSTNTCCSSRVTYFEQAMINENNPTHTAGSFLSVSMDTTS